MKLSAVVLVLFGVCGVMYGQTGCANSPENPTAILALVGSAGAVVASGRARWKSRGGGRRAG